MQPVLNNDAEVWFDALAKELYGLTQVQNRGVLRVLSAYHTSSKPAVVVIAGMIPIAIFAENHKAIYKRRGEEPREVVLR